MIDGNAESGPVAVIQDGGHWWRFVAPVRVITAAEPHEVQAALQAIERAVQVEGLFAAGYLAYEAAAAYGLAVHPLAPNAPPLLWFGLFRGRESLDAPDLTGDFAFGDWQASIDRQAYLTAIRRIQAEIAAGYTYQANFTFRLRASFRGDPAALFARLARAQRGGHAAYLDTGRYAICSASPELFFRLDGERIVSRPMKGTAPRGLSAADDQAQAAWLRASEKNRAENVMIVDMIRNDLGRVARTGSVSVPALFDVERYPTVLQMTSTVEARTAASFSEIMAALFPCASITGAPKVRTMQLLRELETESRGVYCGAIGFLAPGREARFNVAIRTAVIDRQRGEAVYGVGSGVVWDSDAAGEYDECLLKARVLDSRTEDAEPFSLLESLRWTPDARYTLLDRHLERLAASAEYFAVPFDRQEGCRQLETLAATLVEGCKVRLLLALDGGLTLEVEPLSRGARSGSLRLGLARRPVDSGNPWLYHKTTRRETYAAAKASRPDCDDVILWNERGELTESSASNLVLRLGGDWLTPPVAAGLLPGTLREDLLERGEIAERVLTVANLAAADEVFLINSIRGWQRATFDGDRPGEGETLG